jgi:SAM-dependent methyltransferase
MKKIFQREWQKINFSTFSKMSSKTIADSEFYKLFYQEFFKIYNNWNELPVEWRASKNKWSQFILKHCNTNSRVLSVGCGLGYIEHQLKISNPSIDLYIHEVAPAAWNWINNEIDENHKFVGFIPGCIPVDLKFDLIYLATIDYAIDDDTLISLLASIKNLLTKDGKCLLISASFEDVPVLFKDYWFYIVKLLKIYTLKILNFTKGIKKGQFWGWMRTKKEYKDLMLNSGLQIIEDGFLNEDNAKIYWIKTA